ncbi:MAG: GT2 family glycosyltransferase [Gammaproteobacteria bacterium]|jgi:GT2 family glycosyltransferase
MQSRLAVIIVTWNAESFLPDCLHALKQQTRLPDRVIVIDNNSDDNSRLCCQQMPAWMTLVPLSENTGFARANNIAMSFVQDCDYVVLLNPDTRPDSHFIHQLLVAAKNKPKGDFFASLLLDYTDPKLVDGSGDVYHVSGIYWRRDHGQKIAKTNFQAEEIFSPCAAAAMYRVETLHELGGFDESYFCYSEDIDLGFRLRARGHNAWLVPDSIVYHAGSGITGKHSDFSLYYGHRNLVWTFVQNMPGKLFWLYLPQHLLLNLVTLIYFSLQGRGLLLCRAKWHAIWGLRRAFDKRKHNESLRIVSSKLLTSTMRKGWFSAYRKRHV